MAHTGSAVQPTRRPYGPDLGPTCMTLGVNGVNMIGFSAISPRCISMRVRKGVNGRVSLCECGCELCECWCDFVICVNVGACCVNMGMTCMNVGAIL